MSFSKCAKFLEIKPLLLFCLKDIVYKLRIVFISEREKLQIFLLIQRIFSLEFLFFCNHEQLKDPTDNNGQSLQGLKNLWQLFPPWFFILIQSQTFFRDFCTDESLVKRPGSSHDISVQQAPDFFIVSMHWELFTPSKWCPRWGHSY